MINLMRSGGVESIEGFAERLRLGTQSAGNGLWDVVGLAGSPFWGHNFRFTWNGKKKPLVCDILFEHVRQILTLFDKPEVKVFSDGSLLLIPRYIYCPEWCAKYKEPSEKFKELWRKCEELWRFFKQGDEGAPELEKLFVIVQKEQRE